MPANILYELTSLNTPQGFVRGWEELSWNRTQGDEDPQCLLCQKTTSKQNNDAKCGKFNCFYKWVLRGKVSAMAQAVLLAKCRKAARTKN